jgi:hypothetical protein
MDKIHVMPNGEAINLGLIVMVGPIRQTCPAIWVVDILFQGMAEPRTFQLAWDGWGTSPPIVICTSKEVYYGLSGDEQARRTKVKAELGYDNLIGSWKQAVNNSK